MSLNFSVRPAAQISQTPDVQVSFADQVHLCGGQSAAASILDSTEVVPTVLKLVQLRELGGKNSQLLPLLKSLGSYIENMVPPPTPQPPNSTSMHDDATQKAATLIEGRSMLIQARTQDIFEAANQAVQHLEHGIRTLCLEEERRIAQERRELNTRHKKQEQRLNEFRVKTQLFMKALQHRCDALIGTWSEHLLPHQTDVLRTLMSPISGTAIDAAKRYYYDGKVTSNEANALVELKRDAKIYETLMQQLSEGQKIMLEEQKQHQEQFLAYTRETAKKVTRLRELFLKKYRAASNKIITKYETALNGMPIPEAQPRFIKYLQRQAHNEREEFFQTCMKTFIGLASSGKPST